MKNLGDYTPGKTIVFRFNTHRADGTPIALAGTPVISVYKNNTTESVTGVTLTVDYDARVGLNHVVIDTSADATFYAAGNDFDVTITTGTVNAISVVGTVVATFSLANRSALRPTAADRTLDVSVTGEAGLDFTNRLDTAGILPNAAAGANGGLLIAGANAATSFASLLIVGPAVFQTNVGLTAGMTITNSNLNGHALALIGNGAGSGLYLQPGTAGGIGIEIDGGIHVANLVSLLAGMVANINGTITNTTNLTNLPAIPPDWLTAAGLASDAVAEIAAAVATGGDAWATLLPGAYGPGSAGFILGTFLNAAITSRMATYAQPAGFLAATFPADPAGLAGLAAAHGAGSWTTATGFSTLDAPAVRAAIGLAAPNLDNQLNNLVNGTAAVLTDTAAILTDTNQLQTEWTDGGRLDLLLDAIKEGTDLIPAEPAAAGSAMTLTPAERSAIAAATFTRQATEAYAAKGAAPTLEEALCMILQRLTEFVIVGKVITVNRLDGTPTAFSLGLDNQDTPTSSTRT